MASGGNFCLSRSDLFVSGSDRDNIDRDIYPALEASVLFERVFLLGPVVDIRWQYGELSFSLLNSARRDETILGEAISLNDSSVRLGFTFCEYAVFFLSKTEKALEDINYVPATESYSDRLKELKERRVIDKDTDTLLRQLKQTRDNFAHSFTPLKKLRYLGEELESSGQFVKDLFMASKALEQEFIKRQHLQVNWGLFSLVLKAIRLTRSEAASK